MSLYICAEYGHTISSSNNNKSQPTSFSSCCLFDDVPCLPYCWFRRPINTIRIGTNITKQTIEMKAVFSRTLLATLSYEKPHSLPHFWISKKCYTTVDLSNTISSEGSRKRRTEKKEKTGQLSTAVVEGKVGEPFRNAKRKNQKDTSERRTACQGAAFFRIDLGSSSFQLSPRSMHASQNSCSCSDSFLAFFSRLDVAGCR